VALALMSFSCIWLNAVVGTGNTVVNLVIEIITIIVYIIYNYIVLEVLFMSVAWGWASEIVYWICMFTMAYFYIRSGRWKKNEAI
jgi:MATE family multidrug resistance protein